MGRRKATKALELTPQPPPAAAPPAIPPDGAALVRELDAAHVPSEAIREEAPPLDNDEPRLHPAVSAAELAKHAPKVEVAIAAPAVPPADPGGGNTTIEDAPGDFSAQRPLPPPKDVYDFPTPKGPKPKPQDTPVPVGVRKFVMDFLPETSSVRVSIRYLSGMSAGQTQYIRNYRPSDVRDAGSLEQFLMRYVVPEHGYGEYLIDMQRQDGTSVYRTGLPIAEPLSYRRPDVAAAPPPALNLMDFYNTTVANQTRQMQLTEEMAEKRRREWMELVEQSKTQGMDPMVMMLLFNQMGGRSPAADSSQVALEAMKETLKRLDEEKERDRRNQWGGPSYGPQLPPLPPLPPPGENTGEALRAFAEALKATSQPQAPGISASDILAIVREGRQPAATPFSWMDAVAALPAVATAVRQMLGLDATERRMEQLFAEIRETKNKPVDLLAQFQTLKMVREFSADVSGERKGELVGVVKEMARSIPFLVQMMRGAQAMQLPPQPPQFQLPPAPPPTTPPVIDVKAESAPPPRLTVPAEAVELCQQIVNAADDPALFMASMGLLQRLFMEPAWKPLLAVGMAAIQSGDKGRAEVFVRTLFGSLAKAKLLPEAKVVDVVRICNEQFENLAALFKGGAP